LPDGVKETSNMADLASAKKKLLGNADNVPPFDFDSLPLDRNASIWSEIRSDYGLNLPEFSALQNARGKTKFRTLPSFKN
jgi:hypothetical protein